MSFSFAFYSASFSFHNSIVLLDLYSINIFVAMSKTQPLNEETPLLYAMTADQTTPIVNTTFGNAKRSAKASPWYVIGALFGLTFSYG